jgi:hypothetical protein
VSVVGATNATNHMAQRTLGVIGIDACARHQRACRASQVMRRPPWEWRAVDS